MTSDVMMREVSGVIHNSTLLKVFNDAIGKEVLVETVDGSQFKGILAGVSPEITDIGLIHAHKVTPENEKNLLPKKSEVESKIQFKYEHVVCWSVVIVEDKLIKGFATDRSYHNKNGMTTREEDELVAWEGDEGEDGIDIEEQAPTHRAPTNNGGWGVEEMFNANKKMGVTSTFDENLSQYTTAEVIDDPQGRARAEQIAREIESGSKSKIHSLLENDDEERDLDKETCEEDFEIASRKRGQLARAGRLGNTLPATNRRAEGMKGGINRDRVNGGSGRYPANINNNYGTPNGKGGQGQQEWKESGSRRENRENRQVDNNAAAPKKTHLENKSSGSPRNQDGASRRVEDLKEWGGEFNKTFQAPREGSVDKPDEPGVTPSPSSAHARQSTGNAWTRGPPSSLLNSSHHVSSPSSTSPLQSAPLSSGPPSEPSEPSPTNKEEPRKEEDEKQENTEQNTSLAHDDQMASTSQDDSLSKPPGDPKPNDENSSGSKFKFNLAAQPFVPKSVQQPQQAQPVAVSSQQMPPQTAIPTAVPLSAVPVQAPIAAPPMLMQSGGMQPPVVVYPQPVYQAAPQYYGQQMVVRTQSGQPVPQMMTHQNPAHAQQRRPPQTPMVLATQPAVYPTATAQMYQHPSGGYYTTGSYAQTSVPPPQQQYISQVIANAGGQPVAVSYVPQQPQQQQQQQQQRYLAQQAQAQMGYAMPPTSMSAGGNARYPVQQQSAPAHDYQGQGNQTGQPVSQPPTPGPQGHPQPSQSVPPPPPPSHPSAAPSPRTFSPHPHQGGVGMQPTVSAPQPHQFYVHSTHQVQAPVYYPGAMYYQPHATAAQMQHMQAQAAQQQGNTPPQQHPGMQQGDQQHEMPAQYMSQEQYQQFIQQQQQQQQQHQHQQGNYYQGPPPGHMRQGSLPPQQQQQQYVAQQPPQGMPLQGQPGPSQQAQGGPPPNQ